MIEASLVGIIRMILIIVGVIVVIRLLKRAFAPPPRGPQSGKGRGDDTRYNKDDTRVERIKDPKPRDPDAGGEYVDFEEVDE